MTQPARQIADPALFVALGERAMKAGVFGEVRVVLSGVECAAKNSAAPAMYALWADSSGVHVALKTADRWLSHSIEADLLNTGDKMEELLEEELVELGWSGASPMVAHFRDERKQFVFQSRLSISPGAANAVEQAAMALLGYEACFRRLGDMDAGGA